MTPRFFFDETDLLLAKKMSAAKPGEVVFPGHSECCCWLTRPNKLLID